MRPARPRLKQCFEALEGLTDPVEAWRRVAPSGWLDGTQRRFLRLDPCERCEARGTIRVWWGLPSNRVRCPRCGGAGGIRTILAHPASVRDAMAIASDPEGILAAEALGVETAARLGPFGAAQPGRVVWWVASGALCAGAICAEPRPALPPADDTDPALTPDEAVTPEQKRAANVAEARARVRDAVKRSGPLDWCTPQGVQAIKAAIRALGEAVARSRRNDALEVLLARMNSDPPAVDWSLPPMELFGAALAVEAADRAREWADMATAGARIGQPTDTAWWPTPVCGRSFAALRNPFDSLLALVGKGYALGEINPDAIVLMCPEAVLALP